VILRRLFSFNLVYRLAIKISQNSFFFFSSATDPIYKALNESSSEGSKSMDLTSIKNTQSNFPEIYPEIQQAFQQPFPQHYQKKVVVIFGTRPEAIKISVAARELERRGNVQLELWNTGQHRDLVAPVLKAFGIKADKYLDLMTNNQAPGAFFSRAVETLAAEFAVAKPSCVLVQGDTTTAAAASMAAFYARIPVAHIEAGLRTYDNNSPWPEEFNRRVISVGANWHFAPTEQARQNLLKENVPSDRIYVTGNTGVDSLLWMAEKLRGPDGGKYQKKWQAKLSDRKLVLCTFHRRESFGAPMKELMTAIKLLAKLDEAEIVLPLHPNPEVRKAAKEVLGEVPPERLHLEEPLDYPEFIWLMDHCHFILSDSGGIQEEAPSLGKPVIVTREITERPEAVKAGANVLAGTHPRQILQTANALLRDQQLYRKMAIPRAIYGDGHASEKIASQIAGAIALH
jgi:UDP-N-acetylglucosamine 2-epimerase (non-hydrolysing)